MTLKGPDITVNDQNFVNKGKLKVKRRLEERI